jgi:hypothetical protein
LVFISFPHDPTSLIIPTSSALNGDLGGQLELVAVCSLSRLVFISFPHHLTSLIIPTSSALNGDLGGQLELVAVGSMSRLVFILFPIPDGNPGGLLELTVAVC